MPTETCKGCQAETNTLEIFPGTLCLLCWAKTDEANRPITASELTRMWGGKG